MAFKLGRKRPLSRGYRLSLGNYLTRSLPAPPATVNYAITAALPALTPIFKNDQLGDCTAAGAFHISGMISANSGAPVYFTDEQVVQFYSATTGYNPEDPNTDQGGDEQTVLNYWMQNGLVSGQHKIAGWIAVNGADPVEVRTALWLFENLYFGVELPTQWISPFPEKDGFFWDVVGPTDPANGHCFCSTGFSPGRLQIDSWGLQGWITDAAVAQYATHINNGELYTVMSQDAITKATQKSPNGFDWSQLVADFQSMGGNVKS